MKKPSHQRRPSSEFRFAIDLAICAERSTAASAQGAAKFTEYLEYERRL